MNKALNLFAQRLRVAMAASEISPTDVVREIGVSHQAISNWMRGRAAPRSSHLVAICRLTNCSLDWIMTPEPVNLKEERNAALTTPTAAQEAAEPSAASGDVGIVPVGAIENGRTLLDRLEQHYDFACEGGSLANCAEWHDARRCFEAMAEALYATPPAEAPARDAEGDRMREALRKIAKTKWDSGALDAVLTMIQNDARAALRSGART